MLIFRKGCVSDYGTTRLYHMENREGIRAVPFWKVVVIETTARWEARELGL